MQGKGTGVVHVVDDDAAVRESLEALLAVSGFDVVTHDSAEAFLEHAQHDLHCLIVDINMPGMGGLGLLERLDGGLDAPVVVLTATRDARIRARARALGAGEILSKPVAKDALLSAVTAARPPRGRKSGR